MYRHNMHDHNYVTPCAAFALGVMVGAAGFAKISFFHRMHLHILRKYGHNYGCQSNHYENTGSSTANVNENK